MSLAMSTYLLYQGSEAEFEWDTMHFSYTSGALSSFTSAAPAQPTTIPTCNSRDIPWLQKLIMTSIDIYNFCLCAVLILIECQFCTCMQCIFKHFPTLGEAAAASL